MDASCLAWGSRYGCGFTADQGVASVKVRVGWSLSVCVCMTSAYSGISFSHISHISVDMYVYVQGSGLSSWSLWTERPCGFGSILYMKPVWFVVSQPYMCVRGWSGLCSQVVVKQLTYKCIICGHSLSVAYGFCCVLLIEDFASLDVEGLFWYGI